VTKYSPPLRALADIGPQISECISPNMPFALLSLLDNVAFAYFPSTHTLHISSCSVLRTGTPVTVSLSILSAPWCKCPILLCHNSFNSFPLLLSLPITAIGESSCNLYSLLLRAPIRTPICFTFFQLECLTYTLFPMKCTSYPFSCN